MLCRLGHYKGLYDRLMTSAVLKGEGFMQLGNVPSTLICQSWS